MRPRLAKKAVRSLFHKTLQQNIHYSWANCSGPENEMNPAMKAWLKRSMANEVIATADQQGKLSFTSMPDTINNSGLTIYHREVIIMSKGAFYNLMQTTLKLITQITFNNKTT